MSTHERNAERNRLAEDARREQNWKRWGPYLAERQWGTVREDYSADGDAWAYFPHEHARSRAYRWGEDGLLGITDRECRLAFALAMWNEKDPILKERLFGLTNAEGNHGEDVKECYFYLDATPTYSYLKGLYKYPQAAFPYARLVEENRRGPGAAEFELADTGLFDDNRYFDVFVEYAKASPNDVLVRITAANRGPEPAVLHLLPTLWFRNTWSWGCRHEGCWPKPALWRSEAGAILCRHVTLGEFHFRAGASPTAAPPELLFTENETNSEQLFGVANASPFVKDAFHEYVVHGRRDAVCPQRHAARRPRRITCCRWPAGAEATVAMRLFAGRRDSAGGIRSGVRPRAGRADRRGGRVPSPLHPAGRAGRGPRASAARPTRACSGRSSSTITWSRIGSRAIPSCRRPPPKPQARAATTTGATCSTAT